MWLNLATLYVLAGGPPVRQLWCLEVLLGHTVDLACCDSGA